jgi:hypothetical protein
MLKKEPSKLDKYYESQYKAILGMDEIPKKVLEKHEEAKFMVDRAGGSTLLPQTLICVVLASGIVPKGIRRKSEVAKSKQLHKPAKAPEPATQEKSE